MNFFEILLIAIGVSLDAFAVSLSTSSNNLMPDTRSKFRLSFNFGLFQFLMPVIGWFLGTQIEVYVVEIDHWLALGLLSFIGLKMIYGYFHSDNKPMSNPSRGWNLILLSIATSIDALAIGLSLAFLRINIFYPSIIIGITTGLFSLAGIKLGQRFGKKYGKKMEFIGGLILIGIGIKILISHLFS